MELGTLFWAVFVIVVAVGLCGMGYCNCINKKRQPGDSEKT